LWVNTDISSYNEGGGRNDPCVSVCLAFAFFVASASAQNQASAQHTINGCVQFRNGLSVLETKEGKEIPLTGQSVSAHVRHKVALKGTWEDARATSVETTTADAQRDSPFESTGGKIFKVNDVKMISESCK
jgi:hypothetical protein